MSDDDIKLNLSNSKIKIKEYGRGRMKIIIKLEKAEAEGFVNFKKSVLPEGANEEQFIKTVFFMGLEQFHKNAMSMMAKYVEDNEEKLRSEGVDVDAIKNLGSHLETLVSEDSLIPNTSNTSPKESE